MNNPRSPSLVALSFRVPRSHPQLLAGLEDWLARGLITHAQVRLFCAAHLSSPVAEYGTAGQAEEFEEEGLESGRSESGNLGSRTTPAGQPARDRSNLPPRQGIPRNDRPVPSRPIAPPPPVAQSQEFPQPSERSPLHPAIQGLMAELSLQWLLFLGAFLVVVCSGVLAASQWQRFDGVGQYSILGLYTLAFFGVGRWCRSQPRLILTRRSLDRVTCLLIPVNFWAMDALNLWGTVLGWLMVAVATPLLVGMLWQVTRSSSLSPQSLPQSLAPFLPRFLPQFLPPSLPLGLLTPGLFLGLSLLHWGWSWEPWPLVAVYGGVLMGLGLTLGEFLPRKSRILMIYALSGLLMRALFALGLGTGSLGLALALGGATLATALRPSGDPGEEQSDSLLVGFVGEVGGAFLIVVAWVSTVANLPGQAWGVSLVALGFLGQRLLRWGQRRDGGAIVAIGLQLAWLSWRLLPPSWQGILASWAIAWSGSPSLVNTTLGLVFIPYCWGLVAVAPWFQRRRQPHLAQAADRLALVLGTLAITLAWPSPSLRTLTLGLTTLTLGILPYRPGALGLAPIPLIHTLGLMTLASGLRWMFPLGGLGFWGLVTLGLGLGEWGLGVGLGGGLGQWLRRPWPRSAAWAGAILVSLSYGLGFLRVYGLGPGVLWLTDPGPWPWHFNPPLPPLGDHPITGLAWAGVPLALTLGGLKKSNPITGLRPSWPMQLPPWIVGSTLLLQGLTLPWAGVWGWGLGLGVGILALATAFYRRLMLGLTLGGLGLLGLNLTLSLGLRVGPGTGQLLAPVRDETWLMVVGMESLALMVLGLGLPWSVVRRSARGWSYGLGLGLGLALGLQSLGIVLGYGGSPEGAIATLCLTLTLGLRFWRKPTLWSLGGLALGTELLLIQGLGLVGMASLKLTLGQGMLAAIAGVVMFLAPRFPLRFRPALQGCSCLVLGFFALGLLSRLGEFTPWTGWINLGFALILGATGRSIPPPLPDAPRSSPRSSYFKILATIVATEALGEVLVYPLRHQAIPVQLLALAALTTTIALILRLGGCRYPQILGLGVPTLAVVAHGHALVGEIFLWWTAAYSPLPSRLGVLLLGLATLLNLYALGQGRTLARPRPLSVASTWTYGSFGGWIAWGIYGWSLLPPSLQALGTPWLLAFIAPLALPLGLGPWFQWGWPLVPWRTMAMLLPLGVALTTIATVHPLSLAIAAITYGILAWNQQSPRLGYLSLLFLDLGVWRWVILGDRQAPLWYTAPLAIALLWVAQWDPHLTHPAQKSARHTLRLGGFGLLGGVALLPGHSLLLALALSLGAIALGLTQRIRAFLFGGTATLLWLVSTQALVLIQNQSLIKWSVGLITGILLMWIAATFETRREQIRTTLQTWAAELEQWY